MRTRRPRPRPTGRRAIVLSVIFSLLLPGLGHAYMNRLGRALIWFAGTLAIAVVLGQSGENRSVALAMGVVIGVFAALDIAFLIHADGRSRGRT